MVLVAFGLYVYSFVQFVKCIGQIFFHDVSSRVCGDYGSYERSQQRAGALKSAAKSIIAFALGGLCMLFNV